MSSVGNELPLSPIKISRMKLYKLGIILLCSFVITHCKTPKKVQHSDAKDTFRIAFGSCNKHTIKNVLWDDVLFSNPDIWIWGGDIVYADTDQVALIREMYKAQKQIPEYKKLVNSIPVIGTWDDHDYGLNDGGAEFRSKAASQQAFLDFLDVEKDSPLRNREGVYTSYDYSLSKGKIKIIVLDTRYFRSRLTESEDRSKRYQPVDNGEGTILGIDQWKWLENELKSSKATFNVLVSSIQVLSGEHGFETWGNFPHEVVKLEQLIKNSGAKGVIVLSGDRHISEFSRKTISGLSYPLIDFTSSGLTHVYSGFSGEPNQYRVGEVIADKNFGVLEIDLSTNKVQMKIVGDKGQVYSEISQQY